jgi:hypothetical protein
VCRFAPSPGEWKRLVKPINKVGRRVDFKCVKGHKTSTNDKRVDKLAKTSAQVAGAWGHRWHLLAVVAEHDADGCPVELVTSPEVMGPNVNWTKEILPSVYVTAVCSALRHALANRTP